MISTLWASVANAIFFFLLGWIGANYWPTDAYANFSIIKQGAALMLPVISGLAVITIPKLTLQQPQDDRVLTHGRYLWRQLTVFTFCILFLTLFARWLFPISSILVPHVIMLSLILSIITQNEAYHRARILILKANLEKIKNIAAYTVTILFSFSIVNDLLYALMISLAIISAFNLKLFFPIFNPKNMDYAILYKYRDQFLFLAPGVLLKETIFFLPFLIAIIKQDSIIAYNFGVIFFFMRSIEVTVGGISPHILNYAHTMASCTLFERRSRVNKLVFFSFFLASGLCLSIYLILTLNWFNELPIAGVIFPNPHFLIIGIFSIVTVNLRAIVDYFGDGSEMTKIYLFILLLNLLLLIFFNFQDFDRTDTIYWPLFYSLITQSLIVWLLAIKVQR